MKELDSISLLSRYELPNLKDMQPGDDIIDWVAAFIGSDSFQECVYSFCQKYTQVFGSLRNRDSNAIDDANDNSEWHQVHDQYRALCNSSVEAFLNDMGYTMDAYETRCQDVLALSEAQQRHSRISFLVQIFNSCLEYAQFINLMRRAVDPDYEHKQELATAAEEMAQGNSPPGLKNDALEFLAYYQANPASELKELEQKFYKFASIA